MSETEELKVGKRGEIYTTRRIRTKIGLTPGERAIATVEENRLIIQPKPTALTLLEKPRMNPEPLSPEELSHLRKELAKEIETR
jgi:bifunctional DNA-binding transcriptional regulator/antitoxin component of YhaV-PrlF toxin-antitoxin module